MYVVTFYSFKGGVGRTMALVNTAVHLAQNGRRVLLVDFDLEAPGLDTFPLLRPKSHTPGIVEFVQSYIKENRAPDVHEYVSETNDIPNLFVMPSGTWGTDYLSSFSKIDWQVLYSERDGYLLLEDLKAQWQEYIQPDYVLIDSRTGYTDTGGICTRQLPDAVIALFFPNEQNLRGLTKVVRDIRYEQNSPRKKNIELHFVMSNVPDLDDEDNILLKMKEKFQQELSFREEPLIVHRYESLSLLNQKVFVKERPKSRLASEYISVAMRIVDCNLADREGAMRYIEKAKQSRHRQFGPGRSSYSELRASLDRIENLHQSDGEISFHLGTFATWEGRLEDAESLFSRSIESSYSDPLVHLRRARVRRDLKDFEGASKDVMEVLRNTNVGPFEVIEALLLLPEDQTESIATLPAFNSLDLEDRLVVARLFSRSGNIKYGNTILKDIEADDNHDKQSREKARSDLAVNYIARREFDLATDILTKQNRHLGEMDVRDAFNFGMASWASDGTVDKAPFERVVLLDKYGEADLADANYCQCLAIACWVVGEFDQAVQFANNALESAQSEHRIFSCWRYGTIGVAEFITDVKEIQQMISGDESILPGFMRLQPPDVSQ